MFSCASPKHKTEQAPQREPAQVAQEPVKDTKPSTVAVWDFDALMFEGSANPELGEVLAGRVTETIGQKGTVTVIERQRLLLALEELHLGSGALADESTRLRLGKMVGAQLMIFGGYLVSGDKMRLDVRLVNVETGSLVKSAQRMAPASNFLEWFTAAESAANDLL
jgi:curli biogenesis system outer membrane secretion channel CsgG